MGRLYIGVDIGSISINTVVMTHDRQIVENHYTYCQGRPFHELLRVLQGVRERHASDTLMAPAFTGSGGVLASRLFETPFVNEIVAQSTAAIALFPHAKAVIEMGGEDSKLIFLSGDGEVRDAARLRDFAMNSMCAAGTGSFLDQQAKRMGLSIVDEFGALALKSEDPPRIAGRCSVFAKSDMIHLQQIATPVNDIVAGLCYAVARNFKSNLARGKDIPVPVLFHGGVAANQGMVRAFRDLLGVTDGQLIVPEHHASMGAIGALYRTMAEIDGTLDDLSPLHDYLGQSGSDGDPLPALRMPQTAFDKRIVGCRNGGMRHPVSLGLDVGSLSTNVVLIDDENRIVARRYLPTARPAQGDT